MIVPNGGGRFISTSAIGTSAMIITRSAFGVTAGARMSHLTAKGAKRAYRAAATALAADNSRSGVPVAHPADVDTSRVRAAV